jgi:hypothetical protein
MMLALDMRLVSAQITPSWLGVFLALGALMHACSLNPQPLPPGDTTDGSVPNGSGSDASGAQGEDAAAQGGGGAPDAGSDAPGAMTPEDAGDAASTEDAAPGADGGGSDANDGGLEEASGDASLDAAETGE